MLQLNLPNYNFSIKTEKSKKTIFDTLRKKYVSLTPEELVRQHFVRFLVEEKGYPAMRLAIEKEVRMNGLKKRCDAILYDQQAQPLLIIEFKAPSVAITQATFDQVAVYNSKLKVDYFMLSNGLEHFCCFVDEENVSFKFFKEIPDFDDLMKHKNQINPTLID